MLKSADMHDVMLFINRVPSSTCTELIRVRTCCLQAQQTILNSAHGMTCRAGCQHCSNAASLHVHVRTLRRPEVHTFHRKIGICTLHCMYICSARIPNLSGYVSGCPLRNGVTRWVTGRPDAQLQIHDNRLHNGAIPLRNRASSRLSRCPTGQYVAVPLRNGTT